MKKSLFMMGVAAMALASCTQNEVLNVADSRAIGFDAFVGKSTRVTEDVTLANLASFELYGWRSSAPDGDKQIFDKQAVTNDGGSCTYSPLQYWEAGYTYNFEAIAPKHDGTKVNFTAAKDGGTINFTNDGITDLIYAKATEVTMGETISDAPSPVSLNFSHLLSRVRFTFVNGFPSNAAAKITVNNVKITNAYTSASIIAPATGNWDDYGNADNVITFPSTDVADVERTNSAATEHMYLIPHTNPSYTLTFDVVLDQNGATSTYSHTATITTTMAKGYSYNFTATLDNTNIDPDTQLYEIKFSASVEDWEEFPDSDNDVDLVLNE